MGGQYSFSTVRRPVTVRYVREVGHVNKLYAGAIDVY